MTYLIQLQGLNANVGCSSIAAALGHICALVDKKALVVDANLLNPKVGLSNLFTLDNGNFGWSNYLADTMHTQEKFNCVYQYEEQCFVMPQGNCLDVLSLEHNSKEVAQKLAQTLKKLSKIDYIFIDTGSCDNYFSKALNPFVDLCLTIVDPEASSLFRLNDFSTLDERHFFVINKVETKSKLNQEVIGLYLNSKLKEYFIRTYITLDECLRQAYIHQMPVSKYLSICASSLDIQKLLFEIMLILGDSDKLKGKNHGN